MQRKRNNWVLLHKDELEATWGCKCRLCLPGVEAQEVEWHHIKPFADGGQDSVDNIVPLCHKHHMLIHHAPDREKVYHAFKSGGRPHLKLDRQVLWDFIHTKITLKEAQKRIGTSTNINDLADFQNFKAENGIESIDRVMNKSTVLFTSGHVEHYEKGGLVCQEW